MRTQKAAGLEIRAAKQTESVFSHRHFFLSLSQSFGLNRLPIASRLGL